MKQRQRIKQNSKLRRSKEFKKKLNEYRRFLKDDYDWDYAYILRLISYKLKRTRECIIKNNLVTSAHKIAKQIKQVETLLNRVDNHAYADEVLKDFHRKYGQLRMIMAPKEKRGKNSIPVHFKFAKEIPQNRQKIHREFRKLMNKAHRMEWQDLNMAFDLMKKNIRGWWD